MILEADWAPVYLACGATDLRKSVDGLAALVQQAFALDPFAHAWFVFCNRDRDKLKLLRWDTNGFWLYYRRLDRGRFQWPATPDGPTRVISRRQLQWLLDGLSSRYSGMADCYCFSTGSNSHFFTTISPPKLIIGKRGHAALRYPGFSDHDLVQVSSNSSIISVFGQPLPLPHLATVLGSTPNFRAWVIRGHHTNYMFAFTCLLCYSSVRSRISAWDVLLGW